MVTKLTTLCILLMLLLTAGASLAQLDCTGAVVLPADGISYIFNIGGSGGGSSIPGTVICGSTEWTNEVDVFTFTLAGSEEIHLDFTASHSGAASLSLLAACDENDCITHIAPLGTNAIMDVCLPAGIYYILVNDMTDLFYSYFLTLSTTICTDPVVANDQKNWDSVRAIYR